MMIIVGDLARTGGRRLVGEWPGGSDEDRGRRSLCILATSV